MCFRMDEAGIDSRHAQGQTRVRSLAPIGSFEDVKAATSIYAPDFLTATELLHRTVYTCSTNLTCTSVCCMHCSYLIASLNVFIIFILKKIHDLFLS